MQQKVTITNNVLLKTKQILAQLAKSTYLGSPGNVIDLAVAELYERILSGEYIAISTLPHPDDAEPVPLITLTKKA